jgi:Pyruvate/2-oxoacid:ferredoxin oxidoreductase delta subunit
VRQEDYLKTEFLSIFEVPECAYPYIDQMVTEEEQDMLVFMGNSSFTVLEYSVKAGISLEKAEPYVNTAYQRCILNMDLSEKNHWQAGNFYERLGVFCQYENDQWLKISRSERDKINRWYLDTFIRFNKSRWEKDQRKDTVAPLSMALKYIENHDGPISVRSCDCRNIFDNCGHLRETCITFGTGPNSSLHRGHARLLTKEEAVQLVIDCEKDGLMHTLEGEYGMCNCCGDCCFDYLAAKECNTIGTWPITDTIAVFTPENCIACGLCVRRCNLEAFTKAADNKILFNPDRCVGCGICATTCPKKAIGIVTRTERQGV